MTGTGQANNPLVPALTVSADVGNSLEVRDDGAYVGAEIVSGLFVGPGLDGDGTAPDPITPNPPYFRASGSQSGVTNGTDLSDTFDTVHQDTDAMSVGVSGGGARVRCKTAGIYTFHARIGVTIGESASGRMSVYIVGTPSLSAAVFARHDFQQEGTTGFFVPVSFEGIELDVDDEVETRFVNNMGTTVTIAWEVVALWQRPLPA